MKIGELAQRSGLTASRIRFYEASGLLEAAERQPNGYRRYRPTALATLEIIALAQGAGFSLEEIRQLLPSGRAGWRHDDLVEGLRRKVAEIDRLQERLAQSKAQLLTAIQSIDQRSTDGACSDRTAWVLDQLRDPRKDS